MAAFKLKRRLALPPKAAWLALLQPGGLRGITSMAGRASMLARYGGRDLERTTKRCVIHRHWC